MGVDDGSSGGGGGSGDNGDENVVMTLVLETEIRVGISRVKVSPRN
jgi:hypothetical protein